MKLNNKVCNILITQNDVKHVIDCLLFSLFSYCVIVVFLS